MKYEVITENMKVYIVDENAYIIRMDIKFKPSGKWKCVGFCEIKPFGRLGKMLDIDEVANRCMRFKNGKGRYKLVDYDHGYTRVWEDRIVVVTSI